MNCASRNAEMAAWIEEGVRDFCATSEKNSLCGAGGERAWGEPLIGFSRGDDPFYRQFKEAIGPFLWTPDEIFALQFEGQDVDAADLTVISWILPQTEATRKDQRRETVYPSERWSRSRFYGEAFNNALRAHLVGALEEAGYQAFAPQLSSLFDYRTSERFGLASNWSERHAAFVSGLGTFGLSDGLITPLGKAMRCGSVVVRLKLPVSPRPYPHHQAYCLYHVDGSCGACMVRCPVGAITSEGHDKHKCFTYIREVTAGFAEREHGVAATPCGLCQTRIPCEAGIPKKLRGPRLAADLS